MLCFCGDDHEFGEMASCELGVVPFSLGEIPTNRNDGRAEKIPGGQSTGMDESSYSVVVKISVKKKQPHKEDPKPVSACKEVRKVGSEGTPPRSSGNQRKGEEGQVRKKKPTTHCSRRRRA